MNAISLCCFGTLLFVCLSNCVNIRKFELEDKVMVGSESRPKEFPYFAALFVFKDRFRFKCGATMIAPNWVLTAAHCIDKEVLMFVVKGKFTVGIYCGV